MSLKQQSWEEVCAHLQSCEEALRDPSFRRDRGMVDALLSEDFLEFGSSGWVRTRVRILDLLAAEEYERPAMEDFECAQVADGVALVTYRTVRTDSGTGEKAETLRSSLWTNASGVWRVRFHQGTRAAQN
jgi:hypothetical protein